MTVVSKPADKLQFVTDPSVPEGTFYVMDPGTAGSLARHPAAAQHLAEGKRVLLSSRADDLDAETVVRLQKAVDRVVRVDL